MATRLWASVSDIEIPDALDPNARMPERLLRASRSWRSETGGACEGVHFVPVSRYGQVAIRLERLP